MGQLSNFPKHSLHGLEKLRDIPAANLVNLLCVNIEIVMRQDVAKPDDAVPVDFGIFCEPFSIGFKVDFFETLTHGDEHHSDGVELVEIVLIGGKVIRRL